MNTDINDTIKQVKNIMINPRKAIKNIKSENISTISLITYLAIIGIPTMIGITVGYGITGLGFHFRLPIGLAITCGIIQYTFSIIGIIAFGYIINALAPIFSSTKNANMSMKLAVCMSTPWLVSGILYIIPSISFLVVLASIYGIYIMLIGLPILMKTSEDKKIMYLITLIIIYIIIIWTATQFTSSIVMERMAIGHIRIF